MLENMTLENMVYEKVGGDGNVTVFKIMPQQEMVALHKRKQRVAAYCRVSTDDEEQLTSYEAQMTYYTDKIKNNPDWEFAGIFADEGITGTNAMKRDEFQKMIRKCRRGGIDLILTKSISRFARNTLDCVKYVRELKGLGIAVIFEQGNINTLESDNEIIITLLGALAQAESENISKSVIWGKEEASRQGRVSYQYAKLYAFERGEDGKPRIIPEQAEVVRRIYKSYLAGKTIQQIKALLDNQGVLNIRGEAGWTLDYIRGILGNEKYCGDVLQNKTFVQDCISHKVVKNTGQRNMYLIQNRHNAIIDRQTFYAAQAETARRTRSRAVAEKRSSTGLARYSGKFALTQRMVCGDCGSYYVRCTWARNGQKRVLWRCVKRRDYGTKFCANSPSLDEAPLQAAILAAINSAVSDRDRLIDQVNSALRLQMLPASGELVTREQIQHRIEEISQQTKKLFDENSGPGQDMKPYYAQFQAFTDEIDQLRIQMEALTQQEETNSAATYRMSEIESALHTAPAHLDAWDEDAVRQLVEQVKVVSAEKIIVYIKGGVSVEQAIL